MMEKRGFWGMLASLAVSAVLAGELALLADTAAALAGRELSGKVFLALAGALLLALFFWKGKRWKRMLRTALGIPLALGLAAAIVLLCWSRFSRNAVYESPDDGKALLYGGQKVMLIVPHEDDEVNVLGGVTEEYVRYGSDVYVVFVTNGDYSIPAQTRMEEALASLRNAGVSSNHVIFLGYGDQWASDGPHLYNGGPGQVLTSHGGFTQVYGTPAHSAYREGRNYTAENLLADLQEVILEYRPEVIFCNDYDEASDHRAVSLAFEKVMGRILKQEADYRPRVYKGYAYSSAWLAAGDYFEENVPSTKNIYTTSQYGQETGIYRWEDRVRLPVRGDGLSRSLFSSSIFASMRCHASQRAWEHGENVVNGDKVFWRRDTNSLCYDARITVSSGDGERLNDFMLLENNAVADMKHKPYDGVWIPEETDTEKTARITLAEPSAVRYLVLYDHPDPEQNVKNVHITFSDGTALDTGALDPGGAATVIPLDKGWISWFSLALTEWEGEQAGLTEAEAFRQEPEPEKPLLKLMDAEGNFLYDFWTPSDGKAELQVYSVGVEPEDLELSWNNQSCQAEWNGSTLLLSCPEGDRCVLTVTGAEGAVSDKIVFRNPGAPARLLTAVFQRMEQLLLRNYPKLIPVRIALRYLRSQRLTA